MVCASQRSCMVYFPVVLLSATYNIIWYSSYNRLLLLIGVFHHIPPSFHEWQCKRAPWNLAFKGPNATSLFAKIIQKNVNLCTNFYFFLGDLFSCRRAILFFPFAFAWAATRAMRPYVYARAKDRHSPITKRKSLRGTIPQRLFILSD